ncbi:aldo/keto reductase [Brachybacterium alimentarium]|uniref:aldo/keto reductase n=1 Tax=Brachybacterium alimentarium TaxID=47845 RepID=UPI000DF15190|nr:aldo/keto reductase [Brachybacterium alimentarium]RCS75439.1 aldo/keto reductase [Brachybacterium alimentarium]RCS86768.1 aldo/keto reductase [Brachybacterium alimentarium]
MTTTGNTTSATPAAPAAPAAPESFGTTTRRLGATGPSVSSPGLGAMSLSGVYGPTDDAESLRVLHAYLDAGGTLLDTADFYGAGHNEMLIGRALRERSREDAVLSVKFGATIAPSGMPVGFDGRPEHVATSLAYSLRRLDVDHVDVYRPARLDPEVPIEETVGAIQEQVDAGYVRHIGLSEVGADTIRRAAAVAPISDLQIEYSLLTREIETNGILDACRELGISVTAYGVLAKGLVAGRSGGSRDMFPRFQGENLARNRALLEQIQGIAAAKGASMAQLAIAWVAARGEDIVPLVGARRLDQVTSMLGSTAVRLDEDDLAMIDAALPVGAAQGDRYPTAFMDQLDSER